MRLPAPASRVGFSQSSRGEVVIWRTFDLASLPHDFALAWALQGRGVLRPSVNFLADPLARPIRPRGDDIVLWIGALSPMEDLQRIAGLAGFSEAERMELSAFRR